MISSQKFASLARSAEKLLPSRLSRIRNQPRDELHIQTQSWEASSRLRDGRRPRTSRLPIRNHWELTGSRARLGHECRPRNHSRRSHRRQLALELTRPICLRQLQGPASRPQPLLVGTRQMTPLRETTTLTGTGHPHPDAAAGVLPPLRNTSLLEHNCLCSDRQPDLAPDPARDRDEMHASSLDWQNTLRSASMDATLGSQVASRSRHDSEEAENWDPWDMEDGTPACSEIQLESTFSPAIITRTEFVWDHGTLPGNECQTRRASSAIKPEQSPNYEAGTAHPSPSTGEQPRASHQACSSVDLSSITTVEMDGFSPARGISAVEPAFEHFSSGDNREICQKTRSDYTLDPQHATHPASSPPTPQQLAWRSIRAAAAARSPPLPEVSRTSDLSVSPGTSVRPQTQAPVHQYHHGTVALRQEPHTVDMLG